MRYAAWVVAATLVVSAAALGQDAPADKNAVTTNDAEFVNATESQGGDSAEGAGVPLTARQELIFVGGLTAMMCAMTYFMIHTTRWLLLVGHGGPSLLTVAVGFFVGLPATLLLAYGSIGFFVFSDSPLNTWAAAPFAFCHLTIMGFLIVNRAPPGISHLMQWREKRASDAKTNTAMRARAEHEDIIAKKMDWLLSNYSNLTLPNYFDVYEATEDARLRVCELVESAGWDSGRPFTLPAGEQIVVVDVPCYLALPDRSSAANYLTTDILTKCASDKGCCPPPYLQWPAAKVYRISVELSCLMQKFRYVGNRPNYPGVDHLFGRDRSLTGLRVLDVETAVQVAACRGGRFEINDIEELTPQAAAALAQYDGWLDLNGLTTLSDDAAKALAQHRGRLSLKGLTTLSDEAATALRANPEIVLPEKFRR